MSLDEIVVGGSHLRDPGPCLIADVPPHISAHRTYVSASPSFPALIIPRAFPLTARVFLHQKSLIPVVDRPLRVSAHRLCVSASTESHSRRSSSPMRFC